MACVASCQNWDTLYAILFAQWQEVPCCPGIRLTTLLSRNSTGIMCPAFCLIVRYAFFAAFATVIATVSQRFSLLLAEIAELPEGTSRCHNVSCFMHHIELSGTVFLAIAGYSAAYLQCSLGFSKGSSGPALALFECNA